MQAAVRYRYGPPELVEVVDVPTPTPGVGEVLVEVHAVSLNASDAENLTGSPAYARIFGLFRPRFPILGTDVAGRVVAVGAGVTKFRPGDAVFGDILGGNGALAEFACVPEKLLSRKPDSLTWVEAAALPQGGLIALQGVRDQGRVKTGQKVLINGAGGGSGTFALQIAKHLGAEVTAVDSELKLDLLRSLGADEVLDYAREDFTQRGERYDLILDLVASHPLLAHPRVLTPTGRYLVVGGPVPRILQALLLGPIRSLGKRKLGLLMAKPNEGLHELVALCAAGAVRPIIDQIFALTESREALRRVLEGRALGKVVVTVRDPPPAGSG
jgi:NADPH:quinone reductase-like Zn-dependent oxidoreductase